MLIGGTAIDSFPISRSCHYKLLCYELHLFRFHKGHRREGKGESGAEMEGWQGKGRQRLKGVVGGAGYQRRRG